MSEIRHNKKPNNKSEATKREEQGRAHRTALQRRLYLSATQQIDTLYTLFGSSARGLEEKDVESRRHEYGENEITRGQKQSVWRHIFEAFINPFTIILIVLAVVSAFTDIIYAPPGEKNATTVIIIMAMVGISGVLRFVQESRSGDAAEQLLSLISTTTCVERGETGRLEIPLDEVVVGDIVHLAAGDMIPADMRIVRARDLFITQAALSGESEPVEKSERVVDGSNIVGFNITADTTNIAFMGTDVISGSATGMIIATGDDTMLGSMAKDLDVKPIETSFEKGVNSVSWVLIRFMLVMVPFVLFINGFTKGDWMEAFLFAISVAVGLTPEMLPMIVTTSLSKGAVAMSHEKTIIKNLNSIQNLGSIDILCTDKTGTLTQDRIILEYHLNLDGEDDARVLRHGFLNSYFQTGLKNLIDIAIIDATAELAEDAANVTLHNLATTYTKVDEVPFDFERRRMSVVVADPNGKTQLITKGALEEMLEICSFADYRGEVKPLSQEIRTRVEEQVDDLNADGMRVIAVAQKTNPSPVDIFSVADEAEMVLLGYLAFLDPPKDSAPGAIASLQDHGVHVKVLTGDNDKIARTVCRKVGIAADAILLGSDVEIMDDAQLTAAAKEVDIFAKLSPQQKARIVTLLREAGHTVGYMGDGINDAAAMKASDVGISVDTAVDIAKESADVILLEKDLMVLNKGITEGRKTYANMIKYIKMTASSNFGNMFSVLMASAFLPFLPMMSIHLILLNLIYDLSCTTIPWDNVDEEYLKVPRKWDASSIGNFMVWIGPTSSVFDITTYLLMYFIICPLFSGGVLFHELRDPALRTLYIAVFQAGWFVESMWSQTLVIHLIRTPKLPFIQSRASLPVTSLTFAGIALLTVIPFTPLGAAIGLAPLPPVYFAWLALTILLYMVLTTVFKRIYIRRYGELL
ncbi:MAG: magnesium-translocating P-type ATPase [Symbiobacteriaceae bacterium]|nr:magnesium-translocating P-type ATPase [Symbiobacteriaceae bacterium]